MLLCCKPFCKMSRRPLNDVNVNVSRLLIILTIEKVSGIFESEFCFSVSDGKFDPSLKLTLAPML